MMSRSPSLCDNQKWIRRISPTLILTAFLTTKERLRSRLQARRPRRRALQPTQIREVLFPQAAILVTTATCASRLETTLKEPVE